MPDFKAGKPLAGSERPAVFHGQFVEFADVVPIVIGSFHIAGGKSGRKVSIGFEVLDTELIEERPKRDRGHLNILLLINKKGRTLNRNDPLSI